MQRRRFFCLTDRTKKRLKTRRLGIPHFLKREKLHRLLMILALLILVSTLDPGARDAKVVLATLTVECMNSPQACTIVELVDGRQCTALRARPRQ